MSYTVAGTRVIIDHTQLDDALRGTGVGKKLVHAAVECARAENVPSGNTSEEFARFIRDDQADRSA